MQNHQHVSHHKIVFFLVFICAAIMTSVFVYHLSHQAPAATIKNDNVLIFPVSRDVKEFKLVNADNSQFTTANLRDHWTLVFFGFTHCASVCPTTLDMMSKAYGPLKASYPNLQVVLVSLDPERDTQEALKKYTANYNPEFIGVTGKIDALRQLQSQFGIFSAKDAASSNTMNYQIQHTSSIMLINPEGKWAGLFKFGMKPTEFIQAFNDGMHLANNNTLKQ